MKWISRIGFLLFSVAAPFLLYGFGRETWRVASAFSLADSRWRAFAIGVAAFVPCVFVARRLFNSVWSWLETFEHELTHLIFALMFLKVPVGFRVTAHKGGEMRWVGRGRIGETWIALAPYFFPTVSIAVVLVAWAAGSGSEYLAGALGWTTAFHIATSWAETGVRQPDLRNAGFLKSLIVLPAMNVICYGAILAFVAGGGKGFAAFWRSGLAEAAGSGFRVLDLGGLIAGA